MQQFKSLGKQRSRNNANTSDIAARSIDAGDETGFDRVAATGGKDNRHGARRGFGCYSGSVAASREDGCYPLATYVICKGGQSIIVAFRISVLDHSILALADPKLR